MKPIKFKECNVTFAENQSPYFPLPAYRDGEGRVITCWKINFIEKLKILFFGKIYLSLLSFNRPLQPINIMVENPFEEIEND